mgnify:CR=1 FL=1
MGRNAITDRSISERAYRATVWNLSARMVHARRLAAARLSDPGMVKKLFDDIAPRFQNRNGGYTRMIHTGRRHGDASEMVLLELVED